MRGAVFCFCAAMIVATSASQAADATNCATIICFGKPMKHYYFKQNDRCETVYQQLNFASALERINFDISGFKCAKARAGSLVCYPQVKGVGNKC